MTAVHYLGNSDTRTITEADWDSMEVANDGDTTWEATNGWSVPEAGLTVGQIAFLALHPEFDTGAADGPRPGGGSVAPPPSVTGARDDGTALASLLSVLEGLDLITDDSTAS